MNLSASAKPLRILVVDVGGTHIKFAFSGDGQLRKFASGPRMNAAMMVGRVLELTRGQPCDVVSIGYPGVVRAGLPACEPHNLGPGWVGFDFEAAFGKPVRIVNDAAMQALGDYRGGTMLFLGLGTGLGSALIIEGRVLAMELGHLPRCKGRDYEHTLGDHGRKRLGNKDWRAEVRDVVRDFRNALLPDEVVIGGGNARRLKRLPAQTRLGDDLAAFRGGLRLWEPAQVSARRTPAPAAPIRAAREPGRRARVRLAP